MPAVVCHWTLGKHVIEYARALAGADCFCDRCFLLGCQGPDILFYSRLVAIRRKNNLQEYGHHIHVAHPSELFAAIKRQLAVCADGDRPHLLAYALGMCCHYAYDTCAHPYICQLAKYMSENDERGSKYKYHSHIESALDTIMCRYETGGLVSDLRLARCVAADREDGRVITAFYTDVLREMYGHECDSFVAGRLTADMKRLFRVLDDPTGLRRPLVAKLEALFGLDTAPMSSFMRPFMEDSDYDYANIAREEWVNKKNPDERSCEDFFQITERAEKESRRMMDFFISAPAEAAPFAEFTGERSFSNNVDEVEYSRKTGEEAADD